MACSAFCSAVIMTSNKVTYNKNDLKSNRLSIIVETAHRASAFTDLFWTDYEYFCLEHFPSRNTAAETPSDFLRVDGQIRYSLS